VVVVVLESVGNDLIVDGIDSDEGNDVEASDNEKEEEIDEEMPIAGI
jgi:hypothetical protein